MAVIKPFKGLRPKRELVEKVACPPYDVLERDEAKKMAEGNPYSFLHVIKPEIDLPKDVDLYDERVYRKGAENLRKFIEEGILKQDEGDYLYLYRQSTEDHVQTGVVIAASCDDYEADVIKKHELTREEKEEDRTKHILYTNANTGPVFLTYKAQQEIVSAVDDYCSRNTPEYDFTSDGVRHTFWVVKEREFIDYLVKKFEEVSNFYIADGHHRAAAAVRARRIKREKNPSHTGKEEYNYFLAVVFPHNQLKILPYNRAVKELNNLSEEEFLEKVKERFEVEEADSPAPSSKHQICMYLSGKWYLLIPKAGTFREDDPVENLDVSILQNNLLAPILGIENPRKDKRITFVGGIKGTEELEKMVNSGEYKVAFSMYPTSIEDLINVSDAGRIMPPKSTWFEPKLKSGLVVHLLD